MLLVSAVSLVLGATTAFAAVAPRAANNGNTRCYTDLTTSKCPYKTTYSTSTTPCTSTSTTVKKVTSVPSTVTSTSTVTVVTTSTAPPSILTSTAQVTTTNTITTTSTSTLTATATTTTVSTSITTVGVGSDFLGIEDSLPGSSYGGSGGAIPAKRDVAELDTDLIERDGQRGSRGSSNPRQYKYPKAVKCYVTQTSSTCSTVTSTSTSYTTAPTPSTTTTKTVTATSVIVPSATTTVTSTVTVVSTSTATTSTTSTSTQTQTQIATATTYPGCSARNFADTYQGQIFINAYGAVDENGQENYAYTSVAGPTNAYECCQAAFNYPGGAGSVSTFVWGVGGDGCLLNLPQGNRATCPNGQNSYTVGAVTAPSGQGYSQYVFGNTNCGKWTMATSD